jgi:hypothetical protein
VPAWRESKGALGVLGAPLPGLAQDFSVSSIYLTTGAGGDAQTFLGFSISVIFYGLSRSPKNSQ